MKGMAKLILGLIGLVVILIVAAGVLLGIFIDPNDYKSDIEKLALEQGGLELSIDGEIDWTLFPLLGLELNGVKASFPDRPQLAQLEQAKVAVKLMPLLSRQVQMSSVEVTGLDLNLVRDADGRTNWAPAAAPEATAPQSAEQPASASAARTPVAESAEPVTLDIEGIQISGGRLSLDDRQAGSQLTLQNLTVTTGRVQAGVWFPLELGFELQQSHAGNDLKANVQLQAEAQLDQRTRQYRLRGLDTTIGLETAALGDKPVELQLGGDLSADLATELVRIDNLSLQLADLSAAGSVSLQHFAAPKFGGELKVAQFNARKLLEALGQPVPETADPDVLTKVAFGAAINGPANTVSFEPLTLTLDDSRFSGTLGYNLGSGALSLDLDGDQLNADRYLPPKAAKSAQAKSGGGNGGKTSGSAGTGYSKDPVIPVEPLKSLELDGRIGLKQLQASGIAMRDVEVALRAHGGLVDVSRINANLLGGSVRGNAVLDVRKEPVALSAKNNVSGLQLGTLLQTLTGEKPRVTGTLSSQADIRANGRSVHAIVNSLNGDAKFNVTDGVLEGISMAQTICQGFNTLGSLGLNSQQVDRSTPFANLGGNFRIRNGVISNQDLAASLDAMALKGRGSVNLPQRSLDYRLGLSIEENLFKQSCSVNNKIQGIEWPVNCKGSFDTPPAELCRPDLGVFEDLVKQQLKREVQEKVESEVGDKLEEKLGESAKGLLKGLFGN